MSPIEADEAAARRVLASYAAERSLRAAARAGGVSFRAARRIVRDGRDTVDALRAVLGGGPAPETDLVESARRRLEQTRALAREREVVLALAGERSLRANLEGLFRRVAPHFPPPAPHAPRAAKSAGASVETALFCLSDWHAYEVVDRERTIGLNAYDAATMARRLHRVVHKGIDLKRRMESGGGWAIPKAVVACNGDFVSGTIHEVERHLDAPHVVMAVYGCGMLLAHALRDLAAEFAIVEVFCTSGNHGRLPDARRVNPKDPTRNWDTLIYLFAREALRDLPNVRFFIPEAYAVAYSIGSKNFLQYHGTSIKSWNSIPYYGLQRYARNINALKTRQGQAIDHFLISHFHADAKVPSGGGSQVHVNGSLIGGTEFSVEALGASDPPMQKLMFVSDPIGVNSEWPVYGEVEGEDYAGTYPVYPWRLDGADDPTPRKRGRA